ncbi:hypothetical protein [Microbulbifer sp. ALW1]|uniref:hypothetical protein n=1 Tax=Microbulbifer sp. (strain ALW1) TaxID=1516059 RepID=UPI001F3E7E90|nr:hypothetical protein [Microbulbifer sp. ALW1]
MRLGILLILLQSMLLCAEGRAESQSVQLDSVDKVIGTLLLDGDEQQPDQPDVAAVLPVAQRQVLEAATVAPESASVSPLSSAARAAHTIRGPPARQ